MSTSTVQDEARRIVERLPDDATWEDVPYEVYVRQAYDACCLLTPEVTAMDEQRLLDRIACDPRVVVGKPVVKGTRLTVEYILNLLAHDSTVPEILDEYDGLTREDVQACLLFASRSLGNTTFMPLAETA